MILRFRLWLINDDKHKVYMILLGMVIFALLGFGVFKTANNYITYQGKPDALATDIAANKKNFDLLYQKKTRINDGTFSYTYDLYLKHPFIDSADMDAAINQFVDSVKIKYNGKNPSVRSIGIRIYDRKVVWDMGLTPRMIFQYSLDPDYASQQSSSTNSNLQQAGVSNQPNANQDVNSIGSVPPLQLAWQMTNDPSNKINYSKYTITNSGESTYDKSSIAHPLSDKEFTFWLKIKEYQTLLNTNNIDAATELYLNYDLNGQLNQRSFNAVEKDFENFDYRQNAIGDNTNYYPNLMMLKTQLAIYRPQLLYFVLSGNMVKSYTAAQKGLVQLDANDYAQTIRQHAQSVASNVDKYGRINYYQSKVNDKWVNTDPFVSVIGRYQAKFPSLSRTDYSPSLEGNNILYTQQYIPGIDTSDF